MFAFSQVVASGGSVLKTVAKIEEQAKVEEAKAEKEREIS